MKQLFTLICLLVGQLLVAKNNPPINASQFGFIENKGQILDQNYKPANNVLYLYNGNKIHVQLKATGFSYELFRIEENKNNPLDPLAEPRIGKHDRDTGSVIYMHRVDISFNGAQLPEITPMEPSNDYINYYTYGVSGNGVTQVKHYKKLLYRNIYPNIDIEFILKDGKNFGDFKYNFIVHPGGKVTDIQFKIDGSNQTSINLEEHLIIETTLGTIEESIPETYQNPGEFVQAGFSQISSNLFAIKTNTYDHSRDLIIDPTPWISYYGGSAADNGNAIVSDGEGNIITAGNTSSITSIATIGSYQTILRGNIDCFVTKFNSTGTRLWATYFGGEKYDYGNGIAIDSMTNILIVGTTFSDSGIATTGAYKTNRGIVEDDVYILKLNGFGVRQWSTYYGGDADDEGNAIAIDKNRAIIIGGSTLSTTNISTAGSHQPAYVMGFMSYEAFVAKFNSNGTSLIWGTYYGNSGWEEGLCLKTDTNNNVYLGGSTSSTIGISTLNSIQSYQDGFIVKFNSAGVRQWGTYVGAGGDEKINGIIADASGNVYGTGYSNSSIGIGTTGAHQVTGGGGNDAILVKLNSSGSVTWATYLGGSGTENGTAIAIDSANNVYLGGWTSSSNNISTTGTYQSVFGGGPADAFINKFNSSGVRLWGSYYGGTGYDVALNISCYGNGSNILMTGSTSSTSAMATTGGFQSMYGGGGSDAFLTGFSSYGLLPVKLSAFEAFPFIENNIPKVICHWTSSSETNNNYFTVESSADGINFNSIGKVNGSGNSTIKHYYQFTDHTPLFSNQQSIVYYRLKQTDFDGEFSFSEKVPVTINDQLEGGIQLFYEDQNPIVKVFSVNSGNIKLTLYSLEGSLIYSSNEAINSGDNYLPIQTKIKSGIYLLNVGGLSENKQFKLLIP